MRTVRSVKDCFCDNCKAIIPRGTHHKMLGVGPHRSVRLHMNCLNPKDYYEEVKVSNPRQPFYATLPIKWGDIK